MKVHQNHENAFSAGAEDELSNFIKFLEASNLTAWEFLENIFKFLKHESVGYRELIYISSQLEQLNRAALSADTDFASTTLYKIILKVNNMLKGYNKGRTSTAKRRIEREGWELLFKELRQFLGEEDNKKYFREDITFN